MTDKRKDKRKIKRLPITFLCGLEEHKGISSNLSYTGLFITVRKASKFKAGNSLKMILQLDGNRKIALKGVIARIRTISRFDRTGHMGIGIKLNETPRAYKEFLDALIKEESGVDITDIKIDEKIKKSAAKCKKKFACLSEKDYRLCRVVRSFQDNVFFIECLEWKPCPYRMAFGPSAYICNCPVRKEIHRKYKI